MAEPLRRYSRSGAAFDAEVAGVWRTLALLAGLALVLFIASRALGR